MWAIQLVDGSRKIVYLRDMLLDGDILVFDKEEAALRFMGLLAKEIACALNVKVQTIRFDNEIKNEKPIKVSAVKADAISDILLAYMR